MPRLTRKSLAEDAAPRGRSRTPAKASKANTASPSPSSGSTRGKGKAEKVVETKRQGRSASRSKAAAAETSPAPKAQAAARESRSRSRSAAPKEKNTPAATKRGREKAAEEEPEEVQPKRARSRGQSAGKSPSSAQPGQRKGRSPAKAAASAKSKAKSPARAAAPKSRTAKSPAAASSARKTKSPAKVAASTSRTAKSPAASQKAKGKSPAKAAASTPGRAKSTSRSPRTPAAKTATKKKEEPKKTTPRGQTAATPPAKGSKSPRTPTAKSDNKANVKKSSPRGRGASTPKAGSQRSQEAVEPQEEADKTAEEKETKEVEKDQEEKEDSEEITQSSDVDAEVKEDTGKDDSGLDERKEDNDEEMKQEDSSINKEDIADKKTAEEAPEEDTVDSKLAANLQAEKAASDDKESMITAGETAAPIEAESDLPMDSSEDTSQEKVDLSASGNTEEPMEEDTAVAACPSEEPVKKDSVSVISDLGQDNKNGETDNIPSPPRSATKRKFEEVSEDMESQPSAKQARLNGAETEDMEVKDSEPSGAVAEPSEEDILKEYVVINKEEVPAHDSSEVAASVPAEHKETPVGEDKTQVAEEAKEAEKEASSSSSGPGPVFVVPLTQAEEIRQCAYGSRYPPSDKDDSLSIAVEVGSLTDSEISSRQQEVNEELSAANSNESDSTAESKIGLDKPVACTEEPESIPSTDVPVEVSDSNPGVQAGIQDNLGSVSNPAKSILVSAVDENENAAGSPVPEPSFSKPVTDNLTPVQPNPTGAQQNVSNPSPSVPGPAIHNPGPSSSSSQSPSMVTASLGTPDPAFLSAYSSPGILNRAYVPNPAVPADSITPDKRFSLVSYNILAECNRVKADYSYTAEEFLCQEYRHGLLMQELRYLDGDVVCLQEVNPDYFTTTLLPDMKSLGYDGLIMRRTKDIFNEGEATFYKTSVFEMESSKGVSLSDVAFQEVEKAGVGAEVGAALKKYLDRADVVLITRLRCKASGRVVTIGNIHVVWDFSRCPDVQCIQVACAIKEVVNVSGSNGAHVICGDFNSEFTTPAYQMVVDGSINDSSVSALQNVNNLELENGAKSLVSHLRQGFQHLSTPLRSAYSTVTKSEPEITSLTSFMESAVDYQFYSADHLVPVGVLKTADQAVVKATGGLPSKDFPSDHVSMKSVMAFRN